jgi:hypothetical protein
MTPKPLNNNRPLTLSEDDMPSEPAAQPIMSRRALLGTLGGGLAVAVVLGGSLSVTHRAAAADPQGRGKGCNYRDNDWSVRPQDSARVRCNISDNDNSDRVNHGSACSFRDSDRGAGKYKDTIRAHCGKSDNDR